MTAEGASPGPTEPSPPASTTGPGRTWRCPACHQLNRPTADVCACGFAFGSEAPASPSAIVPPVSANSAAVSGLGPFLSVWVRPRATIRAIVDTNVRKHVFWLIWLSAFFKALDRASARSYGDKIDGWMVILIAAVMSPVAIPLAHVSAMLGRWLGSKLGGVATRDEVLASMAWSSVPIITWSLIIWPLQLSLFGKEVFQTATPLMDDTNPFILLAIGVLAIIVAIWSIVVAIKCYAEVNRFSAWKAIGAAMLGFAIIILPLVVILIGIAVAVRGRA